MNKILLVLSCLLSGIISYGQGLPKKIQRVNWEATTGNTDTARSTCMYKQRIVFFDSRSYELCQYFYTPGKKYDTLIYEGLYNYRKQEEKIFFTVSFVRRNTLKASFNWSFNHTFRQQDDSTIFLFNRLMYSRDASQYDRELAYPMSELPQNLFYLRNVKDTTRKITLDEEHEINIDEASPDSSVDFINTGLSCYFDSIRGDSAFIRVLSEDVYTIYKNNTTSWKQNEYTSERKPKSIALKNINYIKVKPPVRKFMSSTATVLMIGSLADIVLAPLISYNLKTGKKDNQLQGQLLLAGIAGFGVSIPIAILGRYKKAVISRTYKTRENNYWELKQRR